jgi:hypothetical protein
MPRLQRSEAAFSRGSIHAGVDPLHRDNAGRGALHACAESSSAGSRELALMDIAGCPVALRAHDDETPLFYALRQGSWEFAIGLIERGARVDRWEWLRAPAVDQRTLNSYGRLVVEALGGRSRDQDVSIATRAQAAVALGLGALACEVLRAETDSTTRATAQRAAMQTALARGDCGIAAMIRAQTMKGVLAARLSSHRSGIERSTP